MISELRSNTMHPAISVGCLVSALMFKEHDRVVLATELVGDTFGEH